MEKKQSSIEWLEWQINLGLSERGLISAFKEAKAMHKEEMKETYLKGIKNYDPKFGGKSIQINGTNHLSHINNLTDKLTNGGDNE